MDVGIAEVDKYLRNTVGFLTDTEYRKCSALIDNGFCDMNGKFYPCRRYQQKSIDLKEDIDWGKEYNVFKEFLEMVLTCGENNMYDENGWCPLGRRKKSIAQLAIEKLKTMKIPNYSLFQQVIFESVKDRYFILFPKNNEYVEYTKEGFKIYKCLKKEMGTLAISECLDLNVETVWSFLDYEFYRKRIQIIAGV